MGWPKIVEDAKGVMYLNFYAYGVRSLSCDVHHLENNPCSFSPICNNRYIVFFCFFLFLPRLAAAFSTTSLTELEQNYSSGLVVENNMSLFAEIPKYFNFV